MLPRILIVAGLVFLLLGGVSVFSQTQYLRRARLVEATVLRSEEYRGPPRGPRSIPLRVRFLAPDGTPVEAETASPFLLKIQPDAVIQVLVDDSVPPVVKIPAITELWTIPLALVAAGVALIFTGYGASKVRRPQASVRGN